MSLESYVADRKLKAIQVEIKANETMQLLVQQIQSGWPENNSLLPMSLRPYYAYRDELTTQNNLIFKAQNILIPPNLRGDTHCRNFTSPTKVLRKQSDWLAKVYFGLV